MISEAYLYTVVKFNFQTANLCRGSEIFMSDDGVVFGKRSNCMI